MTTDSRLGCQVLGELSIDDSKGFYGVEYPMLRLFNSLDNGHQSPAIILITLIHVVFIELMVAYNPLKTYSGGYMNNEAVHIGVALCGAELYGTVHAGVLFGLESMGLRPQMVAGSSAGALIASLYAHGYSMDGFRNFIVEFPGLRLLDYGFPLVSSMLNLVRHTWQGKFVPVPRGVFSGERLQAYIRRIHRNRLPKMPFYIVATDLYTTNAVVFTNDPDAVKRGYAQQSTDLNKEIAGSCSIPGVFTPVRHRNWMLVDGGVRDRVPVSVLRQAGCNKIIAVNIHQLPTAWYPVTAVDVLQRSLATVLDEASDASDLAGNDVFVIKPELSRTSWWSCREPMMRNLELGYQCVLSQRAGVLNFLNRRD